MNQKERIKSEAVKLLSRKNLSENELRKKLKNKFIDIVCIDETIEELKFCKLINDEKYTEQLVNYYFNSKKYSKKMIKQKLIEKQIKQEMINSNISDLDDKENIKSIIEIRFSNLSNIDFNQKNKIINFFLRKGFLFDDINLFL